MEKTFTEISEDQRGTQLENWLDTQINKNAAPKQPKPVKPGTMGPPTPSLWQNIQMETVNALSTPGKAIEGAVQTGFASFSHGVGNFVDGLATFLFSVPSGQTQTEQLAKLFPYKVEAAKKIFDGLVGIGMSPVAAAGGFASSTLPSEADKPFLDPMFSRFIRMTMGGKPPQTAAERIEQARPFTLRETVDLGVTFAMPFLPHIMKTAKEQAFLATGKGLGKKPPPDLINPPKSTGVIETPTPPAQGTIITPPEPPIIRPETPKPGQVLDAQGNVFEGVKTAADITMEQTKTAPRTELKLGEGRVEVPEAPPLLVNEQGVPISPSARFETTPVAESVVSEQLYHGTKKSYRGMPKEQAPKGEEGFRGSIEYEGIHLTNSAEEANIYAGERGDVGAPGGKSPRIFPVRANIKSPFEPQRPATPADVQRFAETMAPGEARDAFVRQSSLEGATMGDLMMNHPEFVGDPKSNTSFLKKMGYDGVKFDEGKGQTYIPFEKGQVKSVFEKTTEGKAREGAAQQAIAEFRASERTPADFRNLESKVDLAQALRDKVITEKDWYDLKYDRPREGELRSRGDIINEKFDLKEPLPEETVTGGITESSRAIEQTLAEGIPVTEYESLNPFKNQSGFVDKIVLARMAIGALAGATQGDNPEDQIRNAFLGMGIGAMLSGKMAKNVWGRLNSIDKSGASTTLTMGLDPTKWKPLLGRSVLKDAKGDPIAFFHGMPEAPRGELGDPKVVKREGRIRSLGAGTYFTNDAGFAGGYANRGIGQAPNVHKVYLDLRNPFKMNEPVTPEMQRSIMDSFKKLVEEEWPANEVDRIVNSLNKGKVERTGMIGEKVLGQDLMEQMRLMDLDGYAIQEALMANGFDGVDSMGTLGREVVVYNHKAIHPYYNIESKTLGERIIETFKNQDGVLRPMWGGSENPEIRANFDKMGQPEVVAKVVEGVDSLLKDTTYEHSSPTSKVNVETARKNKWTVDRVLGLQPGDVVKAEEFRSAQGVRDATAESLIHITNRASQGDLKASGMIRPTLAMLGKLNERINGVKIGDQGAAPRKYDMQKFSQEVTDLSARIADKVPDNKLISMIDAAKDEAIINKFAEQTSKVPNAIMEIYYGLMMLSSPFTAVRNIGGNTGMFMLQVGARQVGEIIALPWLGKPGHVKPGEAFWMVHGAMTNVKKAFQAARETAKSGESNFGTGKSMERVQPTRSMSSETLGIDNPAAAVAVDAIGKTARGFLRLLEAPDEFFKTINYEAEKEALAWRQSVDLQGMTRAAFEEAGHLMEHPTETIIQKAFNTAKDNTFTMDFQGRMASFAHFMGHPLARLTIAPFVRTPLRITEAAMTMTPGANFAAPKFWREIKQGGSTSELAAAKVAVGAGVIALGMWGAQYGLITGNTPHNKETLDHMRNAGWQPRSLYDPWFTNSYISYDGFQPLSSILATSADLAVMGASLPDEEIGGLIGATAISIADNMLDKQWFASLADLLEAWDKGDPNMFLRWFAKRTVSATTPAVLGTARRVVDPTMREVGGGAGRERSAEDELGDSWKYLTLFLDEYKNKIPGLSGSLPPHRNLITGEPVMWEGSLGPDFASPLFISTLKDDPVLDELWRLKGAGIDAPSKVLGGMAPPNPGIRLDSASAKEGVRLLPEEYDRLLIIMTKETRNGQNKTLHEAMLDEMQSPEYRRASDGREGGKAQRLYITFKSFERAAIETLKKETPVLADVVKRKMEHRLRIKMDTDPRPSPEDTQ